VTVADSCKNTAYGKVDVYSEVLPIPENKKGSRAKTLAVFALSVPILAIFVCYLMTSECNVLMSLACHCDHRIFGYSAAANYYACTSRH